MDEETQLASGDHLRGAGTLRRKRKLAVMLILAAALVAGCVAAFKFYLRKEGPPALEIVTVERGDLEKTVTAVGALKPKDYVEVGTQVSGRVEKVYVGINERVTDGDLIAEIDPQVYESAVRQGEANLENLRAQLRQQRAQAELAADQYIRSVSMLRPKAVSKQAVDEAEAATKVAGATVAATKAQIKAAEASLQRDVVNLGYTKIYAPMSGTVVSQATLEGQTINAVQSAPVIVTIANLDIMTVWAQVAEADVTKIQPGMAAHFTTLGMPERRWRGTVRQIQPTPETENDVVLYNVLIDVENSERLLLPSMTVQVSFVLGEVKGATLVPLNALQADADGAANTYHAMVLASNGLVSRAVKVGLTDRRSAQVLAGLAPGEQVVLPTQGLSASAPPPVGPRP